MKTEAIETIVKGKNIIQILQDDSNDDSPRDWDNLGTMVCFHNRYSLGDYADKNKRCHGKGYNYFRDVEEFQDWLTENKKDIAVILPIYGYDHGGLTINTTGFSCPWDSGQLGYIFVTKEDLKKEFGRKIVSKKLKEKAESILQSEVKTYDQFLTGDVYGYKIFDAENEEALKEFNPDCDDPEEFGNETDSCWGFYGQEHCKEEALNLIA